jgi:putative ABC transport system permease protein
MRLPLWGRRDREEELEEEIRSHLQMAARDRVERGETEKQAQAAARREFGNAGLVKEVTREMWGGASLERLGQDLRFGLREMAKNPGFTLIAVTTLALGIGANTTIFSVVNAVWLRPLPYPAADQLVLIRHRNTKIAGRLDELTPGNYLDLRRRNKSFEQMAAFVSRDFNLTEAGEPERLTGQRVSTALFPLLKTQPSLGRVFTEADDQDGAARVVILSHGLWQRRFGGQADIVGQTLTLDEQRYTVVGVMPPGFSFPEKSTELWVPIALPPDAVNDRVSYYLDAIARLKTSVPLEQAQVEADVVANNLAQAYPKSNTDLGFSVLPMHALLVSGFKQSLLVLLGSVAFVLLIACVNVANLLLARAAVREKELAVRAALGAGRQRLIRQLLTESTLLAFCGGALGLLFAVWGSNALKLISPSGQGRVPRLDEVSLDFSVLAFTLGVACLTAIIFGLVPALQISRPDLHRILKEGERGSSSAVGQRLRGMLVIAEVALSLVLLVGAGLLMRSLLRLQNVDPGFKPEGLLTLRIEQSADKAKDLARAVSFHQQVLERVRNLPGVESASVVNAAPIASPYLRSALLFEDRPDSLPGQAQLANNRVISPDYFRTLGIPLVKGGLLSAQDTLEAPPVAIINQAMARRFWGKEDPLGKRFRPAARNAPGPWLTVVGVVGDVRQGGLDFDSFPEFYRPFTQEHQTWARPRTLFIRTNLDPLSLVASVKNQIWAVDKDQTINDVRTMEEIVARSLSPRRFNLWLLGAFAALAMVLASVGIYGVISYAVSQRTREIGVRIALGAQPRDILQLVVKQGLVLTLSGIAIGLAAAFALTRWLESLLFAVSKTDPLTFASVALLLTLVALLACYVPARRATKVDPMIALRGE